MKQIQTFKEYQDIVAQYGIRGCASNDYIQNEAADLIIHNLLFAACGEKNAFLFVKKDGFYRVYYYNNREKTDSVFVQNPLHNLYNDIIYRTGDLGRWTERGELEFVSRKDFQVKHKGNRIELGEIEVAVNSIDGVTNAACIFDQPNDKIVLYYTTSDGAERDIINLVKERIPVYMFPEVVFHLPQMPYNLNGKIDRIELKKRYEGGN